MSLRNIGERAEFLLAESEIFCGFENMGVRLIICDYTDQDGVNEKRARRTIVLLSTLFLKQ